LGAKKAIGCDIDTLAVKVANENAKINNVSEKCEFICSSLTDKIKGKFDVVFANIVADVINILCKQIPSFMNEDGIFITSGIIDTRKEEVVENIINAGFDVISIDEKKGWVAFAARLSK
ncbi:MAG: 50S ribosomal protein L11 methyltransferase, partial [Clostridia bacterium]